MRISNDINKHAVFKAGLTPQIRREISKLDTKALEREFAEANVDCFLKENKSIGGILAICINLLEDAYKKYSLPFMYLPPSIYVYDTPELIQTEPNDETYTGFCITDAKEVIKDQKPFDVSAVFIKNQLDDIDYINDLAEKSYGKNVASSDHFTHFIMHELFHAIHLDSIFRNEGYEGQSPYAKELYKNPYIKNPKGLLKIDILNTKIFPLRKGKIENSVGRYAATSRMELFPEVMTKMLTDSINSENLSLDSNPMDLLKNYPKFIQKFIKRELE